MQVSLIVSMQVNLYVRKWVGWACKSAYHWHAGYLTI